MTIPKLKMTSRTPGAVNWTGIHIHAVTFYMYIYVLLIGIFVYVCVCISSYCARSVAVETILEYKKRSQLIGREESCKGKGGRKK